MTVVLTPRDLETRNCASVNCPDEAEAGTDRCRRHPKTAPELAAELVTLGLAAAASHRQSGQLLAAAVEHGIQCGAALLAAKKIVDATPGVRWAEWVLTSVGVGERYAYGYMRLAHHRDRLPAEAFEPYTDAHGRRRQPSVSRAIDLAAGLPPVADPHANRIDEDTRAAAARLRSEGKTAGQIAEELGVGRSTAEYLGDPALEEARNERRRLADRGLRRTAGLAVQADQEAAAAAALASEPASVKDAYAAVESAIRLLDGDPRFKLARRYAKQTRSALRRALLDAT